MAKKRKENRELKKIARQMSSPEQQESIDTTEPLTSKQVRQAKRGKGIASPVADAIGNQDAIEAAAVSAPAVKEDVASPPPPDTKVKPQTDEMGIATEEVPVGATNSVWKNGSPQQLVEDEILNDPTLRMSAEQTSDFIDQSGASQVNDLVKQDNKAATAKYDALNDALQVDPDKPVDSKKTLSNGQPVDNAVTKSQIDSAVDDVMMRTWEYEDPDFRNQAQMAMQDLARRRQAQGEPAIEKLGLQDYYPIAGDRVAVGSYSRKTLGSGNIYASPGFVVPMGIIDARSRAISAQAKQKAKDAAKVMEQMWAKGAIQYQDDIDNMSMKLMEKYGAATGWDFSVLSDRTNPISRDFWRDQVRLQTFAKQTKQLNKRAEKIQKMRVGKDAQFTDVPDYVREALDWWYDGHDSLESMFRNPKGYADRANTIRAYDSMTHEVEDVVGKISKEDYDKVYLKDIDMTNPQEAAKVKDAITRIRRGNADEVYLAYQTFFKKERIDAMVNGLMKSNEFSARIKEEDVRKYLMSFLGAQVNLQKYNTQHGLLTEAGKQKRFDTKYNDRNFWGTVTKHSNATLNGMKAIAASSGDPTNRAKALKQQMRKNGFRPDFDGGHVRWSVGAPAGAKMQPSLGDVTFKWRNESGQISYVKFDKYKKLVGSKMKKTATDRWILRSNVNTVVPMNVTDGSSGYYREKDGVSIPVTVYDDETAYDGAYTMNTLSLGGNITSTEAQVDDQGNEVMSRAFRDDAGETKWARTPSEVKKYQAAEYEDLGTIPFMDKVYIELPEMEITATGDDWANTAQFNASYNKVRTHTPKLEEEAEGDAEGRVKEDSPSGEQPEEF